MTDEDPNRDLLVVDPDDYQKTKKLESIHNTKQEVLKIRSNRADLINEFHDKFGSDKLDGIDVYENQIAKAVAQYGSELLPLIEESLNQGTLTKDDTIVSLSEDRLDMDVLEFIRYDGRHEYKGNKKYLPESNSLAVYRQLERIQRKLGLGLDLEEQTGPAEI